MAGLMGNANAMGIFLVVGWFVVMQCTEEDKEKSAWLSRLEPVLLIALAMTLSMGSFLAMAAGVAVLLAEKKRNASWKEVFLYACRLLAQAAWGMGIGMLIYLAAARTSVPWVCLLLLAYGTAAVLCWESFRHCLEAYPRLAFMMSVLGIFVAAAAAAVRPSAWATFAERLEMMRSGLGYLTASPLFGVGPFRWRLLDLHDGGKYFNTWHIHNIPIHVGVEMGWIAMAMVILIGFRALCRKNSPYLRAGTAAFLFHNLIDTSFFFLGITALMLAAAYEPQTGGRKVSSMAVKAVFILFAGVFAFGLYFTVRRG